MARTRKMKANPRTGRPRGARPGKFPAWLDTCGITVVELADRLGVSPQAIYNIRNGHSRPGLDVAARIDTLSGGEVPSSTWLRRRAVKKGKAKKP
jgi:DNA-binding XRE family transcriptional regulator